MCDDFRWGKSLVLIEKMPLKENNNNVLITHFAYRGFGAPRYFWLIVKWILFHFTIFIGRNRRDATFERGSARGDGMKIRDEKTHQTDNSNT